MEYLQQHLEKALEAIDTLDSGSAKDRIREIFADIETEIGYLEQRRKDAEDTYNFWIDSIAKNREESEKNDHDENYYASFE